MNLLADESVDIQIVAKLRQDGHDVLYIAEIAPGISDDVVLSGASARSALLITADKDFGELVFRHGKVTTGILLIRLAGLSPETKSEIVSLVLREHGSKLPGSFTVVSPGMMRTRLKP
jgi:predicted nuclease of predicted toxin-antitoxin system